MFSVARLILVVACLLTPAVAGAADGGVHLYLQPLPSDAARLTFTIASVAAVKADGTEFPLTLSLNIVGPSATGRQRFLASGRLPSGAYAGLTFRVSKAGLTGAGGEIALVVPDAPVRLDAPFSVTDQQALLLWLALEFPGSVTGTSEFSPVFSATMPSKPIVDHAGFVTNAGSNTITVFDKSLAQAVSVIETCAGPAGMALDRRRRRVYVACSRDDEVLSVDVASGQVAERSRLSPGDQPREVALTPDGTTLVSVNTGSNSISFFDAASLIRQDRINVGSGPNSIQIDPAGRRAFVFNTLSSSVSVIDIASRSVAATLSMDLAPLRGQFNRSGNRLYVIHERSPYLTVLDPQQLTTVLRARLRTGATAIAVDHVRGLVCIGGAGETAIEFYDPNALLPLYSMRIRNGASHLTIDVENNQLYLVSPDTRSLIAGSLADRKVVAEIDVGEGPYWVVVMGEK